MSRNISKLSGRKGLQDNLFEEVSLPAGERRIPSKTEMESIASEFNVGQATVYGTSSFYEFLDEEHLSKKAYVCNGSACLCAGTQEKVTDVLSQKLGAENVGHMTCLGRCHENSAFHLDGKNYSGDAIDQLESLTKETEQDHYNVSCIASTPVLTANDFADIDAFKAALENVLAAGIDTTLAEVKTSNLRGRGGAGFPTGVKWQSCKDIIDDEKYIICNADEGDPGAYSDRYLLEQQPYRVLFGMLVAGWIAGAKDGVLYIRAEYPESIGIINQAIQALEKANLAGENILSDSSQGENFDFRFKVIKGAGAYICGEETALIASIEGRRAEVDVRPPFPTIEGLYKKPTILNNVETFAAIPKLLTMGGDAYADIGNGKSTGTKLVSLDGGFNQPGMVEVDMDTPLIDVIEKVGGGFKQPIKALHIGGPLGGLVPIEAFNKLTVSFESFAESGFLLGHASVVCLPESFSITEYIQHLFTFTKEESCGKCFPCRLGATRGKEMFDQALSGEHKLNHTLLNDLLNTMQQGSLCALGGGLPLPIKNALQYFPDELEPFFDSTFNSTIAVAR